MRLIIVRHGETLWNRKGRLQGLTDIPISKTGLGQAKMLAKKLREEKIHIIYTSMLKRAIKTAQEVKKFHEGAKLVKLKGLNEMSWGIFEGMTMEESRKKFKDVMEEREKDKFNFKIPKGESPKLLKERIGRALGRIIKSNKNKSVLIVGHGGVNRTIIGLLLGWSDKKIMSVALKNTSISIIEIENKKAKLCLFNSTHHLENGNMSC